MQALERHASLSVCHPFSLSLSVSDSVKHPPHHTELLWNQTLPASVKQSNNSQHLSKYNNSSAHAAVVKQLSLLHAYV